MAIGPVSGPGGVGPVFGEGGLPLPKLHMGNEVADRLVPGIAKALEAVEQPAANVTYEQRRVQSQKLLQMLMLFKGIVENKRARGESLEEDNQQPKEGKNSQAGQTQPPAAVPTLQ